MSSLRGRSDLFFNTPQVDLKGDQFFDGLSIPVMTSQARGMEYRFFLYDDIVRGQDKLFGNSYLYEPKTILPVPNPVVAATKGSYGVSKQMKPFAITSTSSKTYEHTTQQHPAAQNRVINFTMLDAFDTDDSTEETTHDLARRSSCDSASIQTKLFQSSRGLKGGKNGMTSSHQSSMSIATGPGTAGIGGAASSLNAASSLQAQLLTQQQMHFRMDDNSMNINTNEMQFEFDEDDIEGNNGNGGPYGFGGNGGLNMKRKYNSKKLLRQQIEMEEEDKNLTYYQRKKNLIQKMIENEKLLDWDQIKKDDCLYESTTVKGAQRKRKNLLNNQIEIINLPLHNSTNPATSINETLHANDRATAQATAAAAAMANFLNNAYTKEAKSYRKTPRSFREELPELKTKRRRKNNDEEMAAKAAARAAYELTPEFMMEQLIVKVKEVPSEELQTRRKEYERSLFLKEKYIKPNNFYITSKAQAEIPQIRSLEEVRKSWVVQDLNDLLEFRMSPEFCELEVYMNKYFGTRTPQQVFSILKRNAFNVQKSIDYCNFHASYLRDYYTTKELVNRKDLMKERQRNKALNKQMLID